MFDGEKLRLSFLLDPSRFERARHARAAGAATAMDRPGQGHGRARRPRGGPKAAPRRPEVAGERRAHYLAAMPDTPDFLDSERPDVPDIVVARGVTPFHLPGRPVRGRLVRLGALADALLTRHDNHETVTRLTGQALALAAVLASALKFRGSFSLQAKGDGPVPMLLADCTETGALRGYARADDDKLAALLADDPAIPPPPPCWASGYLAFTVDQGPETERHQGIVAIEGADLADMALHYFRTSEQLRCSMHLACAQTPAGWRAAPWCWSGSPARAASTRS